MKVFISYSHDSEEHREKVLGLSERLRDDGISTMLDQYENGAPPQGWARWMLDQLDNADFVLVVCTETYYRRFRGHEVLGIGYGVDWEGVLITQEIYASRSRSLKFIPIFLSAPVVAHIPEPLRLGNYYALTSKTLYKQLYDVLLKQAGVEARPVGELKPRPRRTGTPLSFEDEPLSESQHSEKMKASLAQVAEALIRELDWIDLDSHYQNQWFTPLEARVRVRKSGKSNDDQVSDLLTALEKCEAKSLLLVLGLPGAGKSVAMREFARHMLKRAPQTGILPIYLNLRDWLPKQAWTIGSPPTLDELHDFIEARLAFENDLAVSVYLAEFRQLHMEGKIQWIFDSFDELPAILDVNETQTGSLKTKISKLLDDFLRNGNIRCTSIIASRLERRPDLPASQVTQIEIQPFTDDRIRDAFLKVEGFPKTLVNEIFRPPGVLVPIARTPFYHNLIAEFVVSNNRLPVTTADLFKSYVQKRLEGVNSIGQEQLLCVRLAEDIAYFLFKSPEYGLTCPLNVLRKHFVDSDIDTAVEFLKAAKLIRIGNPPTEILTFAHRRMHEYFLVCYKICENIDFDLEWVAKDTKDRDSAVLHVELANDEVAQKIALACWQEVKTEESLNYDDARFLRALNCQRFLVEAFRARTLLILPFQQELEELVSRKLQDTDDLISAVLATETIGLLSESGVERSILAALKRGDFWLRETAIDACRFLPQLSSRVVGHIWRVFAFMSEDLFMSDLARIRFAFTLSPSLADIAPMIEDRAKDIQQWQRWKRIIYLLEIGSLVAVYFNYIFPNNSPRQESNPGKLLDPMELYVLDQSKILRTKRIEINNEEAFNDWLVEVDKNHGIGLGIYRAQIACMAPFGVTSLSLLYIFLSNAYMTYAYKSSLSWVPSGMAFAVAFGIYILTSMVLSFLFGRRNYRLITNSELAIIKKSRPPVFRYVPRVFFRNFLQSTLIGFSEIRNFISIVVLIQVFSPLVLGFHYFRGGDISFTRHYFVEVFLTNSGIFLFIIFVSWLTIFFKEKWSSYHQKSRDRRHFIQAQRTANSTRFQVAESFANFETSNFREVYVDWLAAQGIIPTGEWPNGKPPNFQDVASTKLAKLEYRWRRLGV